MGFRVVVDHRLQKFVSDQPVSRMGNLVPEEQDLRESATPTIREMAAHTEAIAEQADLMRRAKASIVWSVIVTVVASIPGIALLAVAPGLPVIARLAMSLTWVCGVVNVLGLEGGLAVVEEPETSSANWVVL